MYCDMEDEVKGLKEFNALFNDAGICVKTMSVLEVSDKVERMQKKIVHEYRSSRVPGGQRRER